MTTQEWKKPIIQIIYMLKLSQTQQSKLPINSPKTTLKNHDYFSNKTAKNTPKKHC
jgi:hypothetical protein